MAAEERIAVIGSGGFGTVIATMLAEKGLTVYQWVRDAKLAATMDKERENPKYLPGFKLPPNVWVSTDLKTAVQDSTIVISAVPSFAVRDVAKLYAKQLASDGVAVLNLAKGIETGTYLRMSQVIREEVGPSVAVASLSGPNLSEEVARKMPSGTVIASAEKTCLPRLVRTFNTDYFKAYASQDIVGVELGGVLKNITAIAAGISESIGYGDNSKASLLTLGLHEMFTVGAHMGAQRSTFYGLAGIGDLVATCSSNLSRNHSVGRMLGKGVKLEEAVKTLKGKVAEGINATRFVHEYAQREGLKLPLTSQMYQVLYQGKDVTQGIVDLLKTV